MICKIEHDEKTFNYFKEYLQFLENYNSTSLILDNRIQYKEILIHLERNGFNKNSDDEVFNWIKNNGKKFRLYLDTLKIIYIIWKCLDKNLEDLNWNDFSKLTDKINSLAEKCDAIK